eukprot:13567917-Alexandrium_andersonii.AAC.1
MPSHPLRGLLPRPPLLRTGALQSSLWLRPVRARKRAQRGWSVAGGRACGGCPLRAVAGRAA